VLALVALVVGALLWQRLGQTQQELARRQQDSAAQAAQAVARAAQTEALAQELQARLAVAEVRLSEVVLQRSQLDELMLSLSRSRDDTLVQDLESALRLAQQQSQLTGSVQPLLSALQAADQRIERAAQPRLNPVQRAMARDIERIQQAELADVPALVQRLGELARQVDQWPLLNDVGPRAPGGERLPVPASVSDPAAAAAAPPLPDGAAVWQRAWRDVLQGLRDLVRVGRIDRPEAALLAPEQAFFLRENLKLQLLNARLGLLARQHASAQADLRTVEALLVRYFDAEAANVRGALAATRQLRAELVPVDLPRPDESLAALAAAAGGR
jgi:uroporphyrin-3 C-methyltransferase